jgi:hypothetical protein
MLLHQVLGVTMVVVVVVPLLLREVTQHPAKVVMAILS